MTDMAMYNLLRAILEEQMKQTEALETIAGALLDETEDANNEKNEQDETSQDIPDLEIT